MAEQYTAEEDIFEYSKDGRKYLIARKGQSMPMEKAKELGLIKEPKQAKPSETKAVKEPKAAGKKPSAGTIPIPDDGPVPPPKE